MAFLPRSVRSNPSQSGLDWQISCQTRRFFPQECLLYFAEKQCSMGENMWCGPWAAECQTGVKKAINNNRLPRPVRRPGKGKGGDSMPGKPSYTTYEERKQLKELIMQGLLPSEIAMKTGRSVHSVRYELKSGMTGTSWDTYDPDRAHTKREKVGKLGRRYVLDDHPDMREFIAARLQEHCRPVDIVEMLKANEKFAENAITAAGIYAAIKRGILPKPNVRNTPRKNRRYSKMVSRGMICIPVWIREKFHYHDGDAFRIDATEDGVILITRVE